MAFGSTYLEWKSEMTGIPLSSLQEEEEEKGRKVKLWNLLDGVNFMDLRLGRQNKLMKAIEKCNGGKLTDEDIDEWVEECYGNTALASGVYIKQEGDEEPDQKKSRARLWRTGMGVRHA